MTEDANDKRRNIGPGGALYDLVMSKLPAYQIVHGKPKLAIYKVAEATGVSAQHLYLTFHRERQKPIAFTTARKLIECSVNQDKKALPEGFTPLSLADLEPFLPS